MAPVHGTNTDLYYNGYEVTSYFKEAGTELERDLADVSAFSMTSKAYIPGLRFGTQTSGGWYDPTNATPVFGSEIVLYTIFNSAAGVGIHSFFPVGDALGNPVYVAVGPANTYGIAAEMTEATPIEMAIESSTLERMLSHRALAAATATGNGTAIDNTASSAYGGAAALHVTDVSGTATPTLTVKIQHSVDNSVWVDLITFTNVTAANQAERIAVTGTVNRYTRETRTISGTNPSFTYHVAFGRRHS